jgi:hypothetical protein
MKKQFLPLSVLLIAVMLSLSCSKSNSSTPAPVYTSGQGKITGTGAATFSVTGTATLFTKVVDSIVLKATIDPSANVGKQFIMAIVAKGTGTFNFNNFAGNPNTNYTSGALAIYAYETVNSSGTIIAHEFAPGSGSVTITSFSATGVEGTYTANLSDFNNNGDAPITISGSFSGSF